MINDLPEGHRRCVACDQCKIRRYEAESGFQHYRCHVGICEAVMPLYNKQNPVAYLAVGCYLDDSPMEEQWAYTRSQLDWWPGGPDELKEAFFQFRQYSKAEIKAYTETLEALSAYIQLKGMILTAEQTDMEKLSLESISQQLHIGRTKLCSLAKELSGGHTLSYLIVQRRIEAAKRLLLQSSMPISAVGEMVFQGFPLRHRHDPQRLPQKLPGRGGGRGFQFQLIDCGNRTSLRGPYDSRPRKVKQGLI